MIRALLIDDESRSIEILSTLLNLYCPQVEVVGMVKDPEQGLQQIQALQPDLVFLDIEMPYMNGFSLLEAIFPITFEVIFVTAFENYALKAFRYNALDYLVKPIDIDDLQAAVAKAIQRIEDQPMPPDAPTPNASSSQSQSQVRIGKICLPIQEGLWFTDVEDIIRCEADGKYTWFYFQNGEKRLVCKNLKEYEEILPQDTFFRVHHAHLIHLKYVQKYIRGKNSFIELKDGTQVELSVRRKDVFLTRFQEYIA